MAQTLFELIAEQARLDEQLGHIADQLLWQCRSTREAARVRLRTFLRYGNPRPRRR